MFIVSVLFNRCQINIYMCTTVYYFADIFGKIIVKNVHFFWEQLSNRLLIGSTTVVIGLDRTVCGVLAVLVCASDQLLLPPLATHEITTLF